MAHSYSVRKRYVSVDDGQVDVCITIAVGVRNRALTSDEHDHVVYAATSKAMTLITELPHTTGFLSKVKVTR